MGKKLSKLLSCSECGIYKYPIFISVFYFAIAMVWIYATESILGNFVAELAHYRHYETAKSIFFIAASAFIIFYLTLKNNVKLKAYLEKQNIDKEEMANFFNASLDKIVMVSKDGRIVGYNEAFLHTWPFEVLDDTLFLDGIFQDDREEMGAEIQKVFEGGRTVDFENRFFNNEGKYAWHSWRISRSSDGQKAYLVGRNISRQKEYTNGLKSEKESCLWLLDNMPLPMWKNGIDGGCEYLNKAWFDFTGTATETQLGDGWVETIHPDDAQLCYNSYMEALGKEEPWSMEYRLLHRDGKYRWVCDNGKPLYSKEGEYVGYIGAIYDIQNRKNAEEELKKKEELLIVQSRFAAMGEMISMIAHQWRQPITAIGMSVNNMLLDVEIDDINKETFNSHLKGITEQVQYLSKTIDDFRSFFKPNIKKELASASDLVQKSIKMIAKSYENNGIQISFEEGKERVALEIHFGELLQSLISILNNAKDVLVERNIKNPIVTVRTLKEGASLRIEIEDNAGGIEESIIDKVFNPYFTTKNEKSGTGLGLYMAKIIIEKHHAGELSVRNTQNGALFCIEIPLQQGGD